MKSHWSMNQGHSTTFYNSSKDSILRYINSYIQEGRTTFTIRCSITEDSIQKVHLLFTTYIQNIQSTEPLNQQIQLADVKFENWGVAAKAFLEIPDFKLSKGFYKGFWMDGDFQQLEFHTHVGRYVSIFIHVLNEVFDLGTMVQKLHVTYNIKNMPHVINN